MLPALDKISLSVAPESILWNTPLRYRHYHRRQNFPTPDERVAQAEQALQDLRNRLQQRGIDPDSL